MFWDLEALKLRYKLAKRGEVGKEQGGSRFTCWRKHGSKRTTESAKLRSADAPDGDGLRSATLGGNAGHKCACEVACYREYWRGGERRGDERVNYLEGLRRHDEWEVVSVIFGHCCHVIRGANADQGHYGCCLAG